MILAATGHRPDKLGGYGYPVERKLLSLALEHLKLEEPEKVITGMALGWDTAVAMAAYCLGLPYIAAVPFAGQELLWYPEHQRRYKEILESAAEVVIVSKGGYSSAAMDYRNRWMVDRADRIMALWDGTSGGTGNCVKYARKKKVAIDNLWTRWATGRYDLDLAI